MSAHNQHEAGSSVETPVLNTEIGHISMFLYGMPRPVEDVDAIATISGLGEYWRPMAAIRAWETHEGASHLLIAGAHKDEATYIEPTPENLSRPPFNLTRHEGVHTQPHALHTPDQARWLVDKVTELEIPNMALYVSPYHLLRAYGTVLKTMIKRDAVIPMVPVPVSVSPSAVVPETGVSPWQAVHGELDRIEAYQVKGDVATNDELREYITWMWQQAPLASRDLSQQL
jgi:hypothetical protein